MRKLFPLLLIIAAGCGTTGRNIFRHTNKAGCAQAPCDASCGYSETSGQVMLNEYPVTKSPTFSE